MAFEKRPLRLTPNSEAESLIPALAGRVGWDYMHTKEYYTGGIFKALNQFYHEPGHTFHHALLYLRAQCLKCSVYKTREGILLKALALFPASATVENANRRQHTPRDRW